MQIKPIRAFNDNYIWMMFSKSGGAYVVDPGDSKVVDAALTSYQLELKGILVTHHHQDHTGGIANLTKGRKIPVYGPQNKNIKEITHPLKEKDHIVLDGISFHILETPGHTQDHIVFYSEDFSQGSNTTKHNPILFCGDTLFAGGCGRLFEGSAETMYHSLTKLTQLPKNTHIYPAHEYTLANLEFALKVEPNNFDLQKRLQETIKIRAKEQPTLPSVLELELRTNPFLRCNHSDVIKAAMQIDPLTAKDCISVLRVIRQWKDNC